VHEPELRPERVDVVTGTVLVDVQAVEDWHGRLRALSERMEDASASFRSVGLAGPADLLGGWRPELDEAVRWLDDRLREHAMATELAAVAAARGLSAAEALQRIRAGG
jgi:hypothetical protein